MNITWEAMTSIGIVTLMFAAVLYTRIRTKQSSKAHATFQPTKAARAAVGGVQRQR